MKKRLECQRRPYGCRMPAGQCRSFSYPWLRSTEQGMWTPGMNDDREERRELEYWKQLYPAQVRQVQREVEHQCDLMDYEGSAIYDEYPDRIALARLCEAVYQALMQEGAANQMDMYPVGMPERPNRAPGRHPADMEETDSGQAQDMERMPESEEQDDGAIAPEEESEEAFDFRTAHGVEMMQIGRDRRSVQDLIEVLLYNEIYHRRCRRRQNRSWYFG